MPASASSSRLMTSASVGSLFAKLAQLGKNIASPLLRTRRREVDAPLFGHDDNVSPAVRGLRLAVWGRNPMLVEVEVANARDTTFPDRFEHPVEQTVTDQRDFL